MSTPTPSIASKPEDPAGSSKRVLDPIDRVSEVLFGLIMVLTFTGSLSVASAGHTEVRSMLIGALGCNLAWGVIDALLYLMGCLVEKSRGLASLHALRATEDPQEGQRVVARALPPLLASTLEPAQLETMRERLLRLPAPPARASLAKQDWLGGLAVFLLVFLSTLPVAVPFVLVSDTYRALRISNGIAIALLFICGHSLGRMTGYHRWGTGLAMVLLGSFLVWLTMALGG